MPVIRPLLMHTTSYFASTLFSHSTMNPNHGVRLSQLGFDFTFIPCLAMSVALPYLRLMHFTVVFDSSPFVTACWTLAMFCLTSRALSLFQLLPLLFACCMYYVTPGTRYTVLLCAVHFRYIVTSLLHLCIVPFNVKCLSSPQVFAAKHFLNYLTFFFRRCCTFAVVSTSA